MNLAKAIRFTEWWEYKLSPLLALGYATSLFSSTPIYQTSAYIFTLLIAVAIGAIYVSIVNDLTDIGEDRRVGKQTFMMQISPEWHWLLPFACVSAGVGLCWYILPDTLPMLWYSLALLSFSIYSFKPFRLKHKGIWGVIADAAGAHLFPSLFIVSSINVQIGNSTNWPWMISVSIWSFCYGLRGILWHQFKDLKNDNLVGGNTFACRCTPHQAKILEVCIFSCELVALCMMLLLISIPQVYVSVALYLVLTVIRFIVYKQNPIIFLTTKSGRDQIIMLDYYQVLLPFALLVFIAIHQPWGWCLLPGYILLFPNSTIRVARDIIIFPR